MPPYTFAPFLAGLSDNWYADDALLQRLLADHASGAAAGEYPGTLATWGAACAGPLAELAEESARPENAPRLRQRDAHDRRVDEIVLPTSTLEALAEVEGRQHLGALHGDPLEFYGRAYLYQQNGEAGVACSMACTDGFARVLDALGDVAIHDTALARVRGCSAERVWHAAQFATEIQGGSDIGANSVRAVPDGSAFRLHGQKWFCSNINADYFLVTARPDGAPDGGRGIGLFLVPAYAEPGQRGQGGGVRNGYTIDRLKDKLGTRELATAEVTFEGAEAWAVGPLDRGLAHFVEYVLTPSRIGCIAFAAAALRRAERLATGYAAFRSAFGRPILQYGPVRETIATLHQARAQALAALFELVRLWHEPRSDTEQTDFRILLSLCKPVLTRRASEVLHDAMLLLGGNGVEERFSPLPRLFRDAVIMETWEGPHAVLLAQALRDLGRFDVDPAAFIARVTGAPDGALTDALARITAAPDTPDSAAALSGLAPRIVAAFARRLTPD